MRRLRIANVRRLTLSAVVCLGLYPSKWVLRWERIEHLCSKPGSVNPKCAKFGFLNLER